jgi:hypothetical protein
VILHKAALFGGAQLNQLELTTGRGKLRTRWSIQVTRIIWRTIIVREATSSVISVTTFPLHPARGPMFSARTRAKLLGQPPSAVVEAAELYDVESSQ